MSVPKAVWVQCPGVKNEGLWQHAMRDHCSSCSPWWEWYPTCPICGKKVVKSGYGRRRCRDNECGRWFIIEPQEVEEPT